VKLILGLACAFKAHSSCILLAMALVLGPLARGISSSNMLSLLKHVPPSLVGVNPSSVKLIRGSPRFSVQAIAQPISLCFELHVVSLRREGLA